VLSLPLPYCIPGSSPPPSPFSPPFCSSPSSYISSILAIATRGSIFPTYSYIQCLSAIPLSALLFLYLCCLWRTRHLLNHVHTYIYIEKTNGCF
jgi:hypothetical protein